MLDQKLFVESLIRKYYRIAKNVIPNHVEQREFGFGGFETRIAVRHVGFRNDQRFREYLIKNTPLNVDYSQAYYRYPDATPIENKGLLGAELVFDLDSTEMDLDCQKRHGKQWVCDNCLASVKKEAIKLIEDFLVPDFGFSENEININFSGNRGYHLHIDNEETRQLSGGARKQIVNYVSGSEMDFKEFFPTAGRKGTALLGPKPTDSGWSGKIARKVISSVELGIDAISELGVDRQDASRLYKKRALLEMGIRNGNWDMVYIKKKDAFWSNVVKNEAVAQSDRIDRNVTSDITHLIRLPNTIHGSSGLLAKSIGSKVSLEKFDPLRDAILFKKGELRIKAETSVPTFIMNSKSFGPFESQEAWVPKYVGIYLSLKGLATMIEYRE